MTANVSIKDVTGLRESTWLHNLIASQAFWVTIAILIICVVMTFTSDAFATTNNLFNITRNFAFIGIIARA